MYIDLKYKPEIEINIEFNTMWFSTFLLKRDSKAGHDTNVTHLKTYSNKKFNRIMQAYCQRPLSNREAFICLIWVDVCW